MAGAETPKGVWEAKEGETMNARQKTWAKANGFEYDRKRGWRRADGMSIAWSSGWRVFTPGCGFHPTLRVPA